jgi:peptide subunit release factor RF-3
MSAANPELAREIARRRTFAIISHPHILLADKPRQHATKIRKTL